MPFFSMSNLVDGDRFQHELSVRPVHPKTQHRSHRADKLARGVAQPGLARHLGVVEVAGSNPVAPIFSALRPKKIESREEKVEQ